MTDAPISIAIYYDPINLTGRFELRNAGDSSAWEKLTARAIGEQVETALSSNTIELPWPNALNLIRDFGSRSQQQSLNFRFAPVEEARVKIKQFSEEVKHANAFKNTLALAIAQDEIKSRLIAAGFSFTKRRLRTFQLRDLEHLLSLPHGANFSVPGAGKTTVTFALHLLTKKTGQHFFVVGPRAAFPAWKDIIGECMADDAPFENQEPFTVLEGRPEDINRLLCSGSTRFLMSYDLMVRQGSLLKNYFARQPVHLVLDEAHRMKAGLASQRGAFLLSIATLPSRRDIMTGTPMPQGPSDLAAQLGFLWPGQGLDIQVSRGVAPRDVLGQLYVRTTKRELDIPPASRFFRQVEMAEGQLALYSVVRDDSLRQLTNAITAVGGVDFIRARSSVMRLLQLSTNPILALQGITKNIVGLDSGIVDQVLLEGPSLKMRAVERHTRELASAGKKVIIWTIFTDTIYELERMLADLNPVTLFGGVPNGEDTDLSTREGRIRRFHKDSACMVVIANPAACGEGISLHTVCHNAIYVDRSYVSTHYLQSIDRIHRLGLPPGTETNIYIYQTKAPAGLGSIDYSVNRRLAVKIRALQQLLDDPDLHELALDEENADDPLDYDVRLQDLVDLVEELEGRSSCFEAEGV